MPVSIGSGLTRTLRQQSLQQQINAQYFRNANSFLDLGTRLDFLTQFADARDAGLSPTQALLGIQQTAANPLVSNLGLQNFQAQSAQLAPLAIGAATQGSPTLLNQLNASIGRASVDWCTAAGKYPVCDIAVRGAGGYFCTQRAISTG
jgi:hypothetical protein